MFLIFVLSLIALAMGTALVLKAKKNAELGTGGCKFIGYVISILALIMLVFAGFVSVKQVGFMCKRAMPQQVMVKQVKMIKNNK